MDTLLEGIACKIFLDSSTAKIFKPEHYYLRNKSLHGLPRFSSKAKVIHIANGASVNIIFSIPFIMIIQGHIFEIYTMVSAIYYNAIWHLGVKTLLNWKQK